MSHRKINTTLALVISCGLTVFGQTPQFNIIKPSTTGVPGEEVRVMKFDLNGNLWIAGRFYFWGEAARGHAIGRSTRSSAIARRWVRHWRVEGLVERASSDSVALHQRHGVRCRWSDLDCKRWRVDAIRPGGADRRADVVHVHSGKLAVDPQRGPLARVGQPRQPVANQRQRAVVKRRAVSVQSRLQRVDGVSGRRRITMEPAVVQRERCLRWR